MESWVYSMKSGYDTTSDETQISGNTSDRLQLSVLKKTSSGLKVMKEIGEISEITFDQMKTSQITLETFLKTNVLDKYQLNYQMLIK